MNTVWTKIKPWLGLAGVFLVGALLGAALTMKVMHKHLRMARHNPPPRAAEVIVKKLSRELALTDQQKVTITQILKNGEPTIRQANRDRNTAMRKIFENTREQIRATLTVEQQTKYDGMMRRLKERGERERRKPMTNHD
ncbi:MAG: hypothetical protein LBK60_09335 [Verrucomicrobiales bacterium]|jgi:hypothetical protein|nr:hypothetical protein [Verrucomicrobiales bacterium]